jgi:hypothetical protein
VNVKFQLADSRNHRHNLAFFLQIKQQKACVIAMGKHKKKVLKIFALAPLWSGLAW